ncbi:LCP family protein [Pelotomaculum propionicicum]|uniref:LCP family protein n=1 Tax=Pelotomaculum propionicicum TaxID=258475 RepID=UPI003B7D70A2
MNKPKRRLRRKVPFIICSLLLAALLAAGYYQVNKILNPGDSIGGITIPTPLGKRTNVLLLGIDARQGETMARTDSIIMASIDPKTKQIALLSIPRDTRVNIPGHGWDKINSASVYGGPELTTRVVSDLLGISLKYYVMTNFSGFKDIVDTLGGVTIDVEQNMYHEDETDLANEINLRKGLQRLDGDKALQYVRYRGYVQGDIDRTKHQQVFLMALAKEILQPSTIPKLPKLIPEINKYVKTNVGTSDMVKMASTLKSIEDYNMVAQTLPGRNIDIGGGSYWGVDPSEAKQMLAKLFNGEITTDIVLNTPLSGQYAPPVETEEEQQADDTKQQDGSKTGQNPIKPATSKPKPGTTDGTEGSDSTDGSGPSVIITPVEDDDTGTSSGSDKTGTSGSSKTTKKRTST